MHTYSRFPGINYVTNFIEEVSLPDDWKPNINALDKSKRIDEILNSMFEKRKVACVLQKHSAPYYFHGYINIAIISSEKYEKKATRNGIGVFKNENEVDADYDAIIYPCGNFGITMHKFIGSKVRKETLNNDYERLESKGFIFLDVLEGTGVLKKEIGLFSHMGFLNGNSTHLKAFTQEELKELVSGFANSIVYRIERPLETRLVAVITKN